MPAFVRRTETVRTAPVTFRGKLDVPIASSLPRETFDRLEALCLRRGVSKSAFIRALIETQLGLIAEAAAAGGDDAVQEDGPEHVPLTERA